MKVLRAFGRNDLRVVEAPIPDPGPGYVRIKVRASGICGSDKWLWNVGGEVRMVIGHEVAGDVDAVGEGVRSLAAGDRVMVNNVVGCGECAYCRAGSFVLCPRWDGKDDVNNGFGEYLAAPARNCVRLLPGLDYVDGALIMDNWGTPYGAIRRAGIEGGMDVLVNGCGPIGQASVALLASMGVCALAVDPIEGRREAALRGGARAAFTPDELPAAAHKATGGAGVHAAFDCSGKGASYGNLLRSLKCEGTLVTIGEEAECTLKPSEQLIRRALTIMGTWYSTIPHATEVMHLAAQGRIDVRSSLTHTVTLEEAARMYGSIVNCEEGIIKCVIVF